MIKKNIDDFYEEEREKQSDIKLIACGTASTAPSSNAGAAYGTASTAPSSNAGAQSSSVHSENIKMLLMEYQILNLLTIYMEELNMDDIMTRKQTTACEEVDKEN
jgi:hypothetical protein